MLHRQLEIIVFNVKQLDNFHMVLLPYPKWFFSFNVLDNYYTTDK